MIRGGGVTHRLQNTTPHAAQDLWFPKPETEPMTPAFPVRVTLEKKPSICIGHSQQPQRLPLLSSSPPHPQPGHQLCSHTTHLGVCYSVNLKSCPQAHVLNTLATVGTIILKASRSWVWVLDAGP